MQLSAPGTGPRDGNDDELGRARGAEQRPVDYSKIDREGVQVRHLLVAGRNVMLFVCGSPIANRSVTASNASRRIDHGTERSIERSHQSGHQ